MPNIKQGLRNLKEDYVDGSHWIIRTLGVLVIVYGLVSSVLGFYWNSEPDIAPPPTAQTSHRRSHYEGLIVCCQHHVK